MASAAQIEANRANAGRSTGPRTEAGKAVSAQNATRHGMSAALTLDVEKNLLPEEDRQRFLGYYECMMEDQSPEGEVEEMLVERLCVLHWRQRRLSQLELKIYLEEPLPVPSQMEVFVRRLNSLGRYENTLMRLVRETEGQLETLQKNRLAAAEWRRRVELDAMGDEGFEEEDLDEDEHEEEALDDLGGDGEPLSEGGDGKSRDVAPAQNEANPVAPPAGPKSVQPLVGRTASAGELAVAKLLRGK